MPEMDGLEATMKIRAIEIATGGERTPIIALTANAMMGDRDKCIQAGMDDYLSKPIRKDLLLKTIHKWDNSDASIHSSNPIAQSASA